MCRAELFFLASEVSLDHGRVLLDPRRLVQRDEDPVVEDRAYALELRLRYRRRFVRRSAEPIALMTQRRVLDRVPGAWLGKDATRREALPGTPPRALAFGPASPSGRAVKRPAIRSPFACAYVLAYSPQHKPGYTIQRIPGLPHGKGHEQLTLIFG